MKRLSLAMQKAQFHSSKLFHLLPYKVQYNSEDYFVGTIAPLRLGEESATILPHTCLVQVEKTLHEEIKSLNFPGSINVRFIQQDRDNWVTIFASNRRLVSAYMRLRTEDVQALVADSLDPDR